MKRPGCLVPVVKLNHCTVALGTNTALLTLPINATMSAGDEVGQGTVWLSEKHLHLWKSSSRPEKLSEGRSCFRDHCKHHRCPLSAGACHAVCTESFIFFRRQSGRMARQAWEAEKLDSQLIAASVTLGSSFDLSRHPFAHL